MATVNLISGVSAGDGKRYQGEAVYLFAFDVASEMKRQPIQTLLGQPVQQFTAEMTKRAPRELFFYLPQMVQLPPQQRIGPGGPITVQRAIKLFPVGAISIAVRVPFEADTIEDLVAYHDLMLDAVPLQQEVRELAERIRRELSPYVIKPVEQLRDEEAYTVFCLRPPLKTSEGRELRAEDWLLAHRRSVAALLTQEPDGAHLSDQEADESTGLYLSYYDSDLVVIDWDAALVVEDAKSADETLHIMELANVQLAEMEAYDRMLDDSLERSYRDMTRRGWKRDSLVLRSLREIRVDLARLSDELSNITKFFGDWHLARIYQHLSTRFHLSDWQRALDEKLKTLDGLYQILRQDQLNRYMLLLEATIVVLFIIDLMLLLPALMW